MARSVDLGGLEDVVDRLVASGHFASEAEVLRAGVRLVADREKRRAALDAALQTGLDDVAAGRVHDADTVFDDLIDRYERMAEERGL